MDIQAVIITYYPEIENLTRLCSTLLENKVGVIIVDNSEISSLSNFFEENSNMTIIPLNTNTGIAHAQNIGIHRALDRNAGIVVFFDQDSQIGIDFISNLLAPIKSNGPIMIGPVFRDAKEGYEYPSFRFDKLGLLRKVYSDKHKEPYEVDVIISSGSAVTKEVFRIAGFMDEEFFIDFVDIEWSLRCRSRGIPVLISPKAVMEHSIGDFSIKVGTMRSVIHSPFRSYYKLRNSFLFFRKRNTPFLLGLKEILAALCHQFIQLFYVNDKKEYFKVYWLAIRDGILGVNGKLNL